MYQKLNVFCTDIFLKIDDCEVGSSYAQANMVFHFICSSSPGQFLWDLCRRQ